MESHAAVEHPLAPALSTDEQDILDNIDSRMHGPMKGFMKKYFGKLQYVRLGSFLEIQSSGRAIGCYTVSSATPSVGNFLQWFSNYVSRELDDARSSWHIDSGSLAPGLKGDINGGARLLLTIPASPTSTL
jgi:hypothetical protein